MDDERRPVPGPPTIGVKGTLQTLRELRDIEWARLRVALEIEAKRGIVFPETTVIIHDIWRLTMEIAKLERGEAEPAAIPRQRRPVPATDDGDLDQLLAGLGLENA